MSPTHDAAECPACSAGIPCRVVTRRHARYWDLYRADPATWGPVLVREAREDLAAGFVPVPAADPPPDGVRPSAAGPVPELPDGRAGDDEGQGRGLARCGHRATRWVCSEGRAILNCALGRGQAGIVEREDCGACEVPAAELVQLGAGVA